MTIYRVGKVNDPRPDDPTTTDWQEAMELAALLESASEWDSYVVAIWEGDDGVIRALRYQGQLFCD